MQFLLTAGWEDGIADLTERLVRELAKNQKVLWLVSGGSNIPASSQIMENIPHHLSGNLIIMLVDERYGPVGHEASNWTQLINKGLHYEDATILPVLQDGLDLKATAKQYNKTTAQALENSDIVIAQLGIGPDGHIAGILPETVATQDTDDFAIGYEAEDFDRLTLTFKALRQVDVAYTFAFGHTKQQALKSLKSKRQGLDKQPSEILAEIKEAYIYNDQLGEHK